MSAVSTTITRRSPLISPVTRQLQDIRRGDEGRQQVFVEEKVLVA
jgi:hypothetical protein